MRGFMSIMQFQLNSENIPNNFREKIVQILNGQNNKNAALMPLYCPKPDTYNQPKWKFAVIFQNDTSAQQFVEEVGKSEEKQQRLAIEDYSVFANVMFAFMRRQFKLPQWVQIIKDVVANQPVGIMIFTQRLKQLADLIEKGIPLVYKIEWDYNMQPRRYNKKNNQDDEESQSSQIFPIRPPRKRMGMGVSTTNRLADSSRSKSKSATRKKPKINETIVDKRKAHTIVGSRSPSITRVNLKQAPTLIQKSIPTVPKINFLDRFRVKDLYTSAEMHQVLSSVAAQIQEKMDELNNFYSSLQHFILKLENNSVSDTTKQGLEEQKPIYQENYKPNSQEKSASFDLNGVTENLDDDQ